MMDLTTYLIVTIVEAFVFAFIAMFIIGAITQVIIHFSKIYIDIDGIEEQVENGLFSLIAGSIGVIGFSILYVEFTITDPYIRGIKAALLLSTIGVVGGLGYIIWLLTYQNRHARGNYGKSS